MLYKLKNYHVTITY